MRLEIPWIIGISLNSKLAIGALIVILFASLLIGGYYWLNRPTGLIPFKPEQMITSDVSPFHPNVAQGTTFQVNVTLKSFLETEISIPFENLTLRFSNWTYYDISPQEKTFNYTFNPNPLNIASMQTNSSILIVELAKDIPIGDYTMVIAFGNSQLTNKSGDTFSLTVTNP
jgi:hypothetical protein